MTQTLREACRGLADGTTTVDDVTALLAITPVVGSPRATVEETDRGDDPAALPDNAFEHVQTAHVVGWITDDEYERLAAAAGLRGTR